MPMTVSPASSSRVATWKPMKPAAPVTRMVMARSSEVTGREPQHRLRGGAASEAPIGDAGRNMPPVDRRLHIDEDAPGREAREQRRIAAVANNAMRNRENEAVETGEGGAVAQLPRVFVPRLGRI